MEMLKNSRQKYGRAKKGQAATEHRFATAGSRRGQAAMEYLMTYGWAILVIVIVLGILFIYLTQFAKTPESCIFSDQRFSCSEPKPKIYEYGSASQVAVAIRMRNQQNEGVELIRIICTNANPSQVNPQMATPIADVLPAGTASSLAGGSSVDLAKIGCKKVNGQTASNLQLPKGSDFKGSVIVWYKFEDEIQGVDIERQARATVGGSVLEGSAQ